MPSLAERRAVAQELHSAAIRLLRSVRREDLATGMSPARLSVLSVLVFGGARTLGELAAIEQVKPPTMTRLVRSLERDGFVRCDPDPDDGRVVRVNPTSAGTELLHEGRRRRVDALAGMLEPLDARALANVAAAAGSLSELFRNAPAAAPAGAPTRRRKPARS
jgi:DNA-binding MarR family transcriptional regulator